MTRRWAAQTCYTLGHKAISKMKDLISLHLQFQQRETFLVLQYNVIVANENLMLH